jgi:hypothetical protein
MPHVADSTLKQQKTVITKFFFSKRENTLAKGALDGGPSVPAVPQVGLEKR